MIEAIRGAQQTVTLETFIFKSDKVGQEFVAALSERARAGVKIHVIADALGSMSLSKADVDALTDAGVQLVKYNPPRGLKLFRVNHRTHRKIMVVDGRIGFIGGVCLSDEWLGNGEASNVWRDTHLRVEGPVVAQMQAVFADNWLEAQSEVLEGPEYFPELKPAGSIEAQCFASGPLNGVEQARLSYLFAIAAARKNIRLAHSYFTPSTLAIEALLEARQRGVRIEIVVPRKFDNKLVGSASRSRWGELMQAGVAFYEFQPALYHCKIMIVDDLWATVGSVNFDERSFRLNDEANLNILDREFAARLIQTFEEDKRKSQPLQAQNFRRRNWISQCWDRFAGLFRSQL
jgi:cardiolipin synthase